MEEYHYVQEVPADLLCAVCYHTLREPRCCPRCQKAFCAVCISTWASTQKRKEVPFSCPYCRTRLRLSHLFRPEILNVRLGELLVLCPYGCSSTVRRADLANHVACVCPGLPARCPDCDASMPRGQLAAHVGSSDCPNCRMDCPNQPFGCQVQLKLQDMPCHVVECPYGTLECRHCRATVLRGQAEEHCFVACPRLCPCPNRCYGCEHVASSLKRLAKHVVKHCRYGASSAYMTRMLAALGPGELCYRRGGSKVSLIGSRVSRSGAAATASISSCHAYSIPSYFQHSPLNSYSGCEVEWHPGGGQYGVRQHAPTAAVTGAGVWCYGLFIPASLYPNGLPEPLLKPTDASSGSKGATAAQPMAPYPWVMESTGEASNAEALAIKRHFLPAPNTDQLRQEIQRQHAAEAAPVIPERYCKLLRLVRGEDGMHEDEQWPDAEEDEEDGEEEAHQQYQQLCGALNEQRCGPIGDADMSDVEAKEAGVKDCSSGSSKGSITTLSSKLELPPPDALWWRCPAVIEHANHGLAAPAAMQTSSPGRGDPVLAAATKGGETMETNRKDATTTGEEQMDLLSHPDHLTAPAAIVYGTLIALVTRLYEHGNGGSGRGGGGVGESSSSSDHGVADSEIPRPPVGSRDFKLLQLYEGEDNALVDLPSCNTALHHGYRAFWALGLLRLARRHWPAASLHWRSLAALNDLTTALARKLLARVVEVLSCELVQESCPMGEGDVFLAVQTILPGPLATEALEAVRNTLHMYDDAFWDTDPWMEGWSSLRGKLELGLELGRVACMVGQYTPLHGDFMAGEDDPQSDESVEEESDTDSSDDDDDDDNDDGSSSGGMGAADDGDIEAVPRGRGVSSSSRSRSSMPALEPMSDAEEGDPEGRAGDEAAGHSQPRRPNSSSQRGAGGHAGIQRGGIRAPALQLFNDAQRRLRGLGLGIGRGGGGGGGGGDGQRGLDSSSDSSGDWESMSEEEAAELLQQQQQQQAANGQGRPGGWANGLSIQLRVRRQMAGGGRDGGSGGGTSGSESEGFTDEMDVASSDSGEEEDSHGDNSHADIRGVVALAAVLEWFVASLLEKTRSCVESGLMQLGDGHVVQPWHLQLVLDISPLGQVLLRPRSGGGGDAAAEPAKAVARNGYVSWIHGSKEPNFWEGPSLGSQLVGAMPLRQLAHMIASLALQPVSALLVLVTTGAEAPAASAAAPLAVAGIGSGSGNGSGSGSEPGPLAPSHILCPLDMQFYCGGAVMAGGVSAGGPQCNGTATEVESRGAFAPPCSYWSGHQCAGCQAATFRIRQLPFDERLNLAGDVLWRAFKGACGEGGQREGEQQPLSNTEAHSSAAATGLLHAVLHPPADLVAKLTGGRLRGEMLQCLLPSALRPLLRSEALSNAARLANLGLTLGLVRIHQMETPCWWRQPGGTACIPAATLLAAGEERREQEVSGSLAAVISPALAEAVRPETAWLQQLQLHLGSLRDVAAVAALCRDLGAVWYSMPDPGVGPTVSTGARPEMAATTPPPAGQIVSHAPMSHRVGDADDADSKETNHDNDNDNDNDAGIKSNQQHDGIRTAGDLQQSGGGSGAAMRGILASSACGAPAELPLCIPHDVFMDLFRECWTAVCGERSGGGGATAAPSVAILGSREQHQHQRAETDVQLGGNAQHGRRQGRPVMPPAMGLVSDSMLRRHFRPTIMEGQGAQPAAPGGARIVGGSGATAAGETADPGRTGPAPAGPNHVEEPGGPQQHAGGSSCAGGRLAVDGGEGEGEGEDMEVDWSLDALELLQRAAEAVLAEAMQEGEGLRVALG